MRIARQTPTSAKINAQTRKDAFSVFSGKWKGKLEYRDYKTNKRVVLPVRVEVILSPDGATLIHKAAYYGERVDKTSVTLDLVTGNWVEDAWYTYFTAGFPAFAASKTEVLTLTGEATDDGKSAPVRQTITVSGDDLTVLRGVRTPGSVPTSSWQFRSQWTLKRVR